MTPSEQRIQRDNDCIQELQSEINQLRASLAEKERENTQLKRENENTWRAHGQIVSQLSALQSELATAQKKADAEMERVKACEHIAEGDEGWEALANLCPSTAAVTALRYQLQTAMEERDATAKEAIKKLIDVKVLLSGEPKLPIHAIDIINDLMTRLSSSRSTGRKDNTL